MPIPVVCSCAAKLKVGDHLKGKHIKCPRCGSLIAVGGANGSSAAPAAPTAKAEPALPTSEEMLGQSDLSEPERQRLSDVLARDERLLWAGKPSARVAFLRAWFISGGLWSGAVIILIILIVLKSTGALHDAGGVITFVLLLIAIVGLTAAGFVIPYGTRWYKRRTTYAATTRRALAWVPDWFGKIKFVTYDPADLVKLYRVEIARSEGGVGHLIFGSFTKRKKTKEGIELTTYVYGFWLVPRAAHVEKLLREHLVDPLLDKLYEEG
jgi:hypothetical protein